MSNVISLNVHVKDVYTINFPNSLDKPLHLTGGNVMRSNKQDKIYVHNMINH